MDGRDAAFEYDIAALLCDRGAVGAGSEAAECGGEDAGRCHAHAELVTEHSEIQSVEDRVA